MASLLSAQTRFKTQHLVLAVALAEHGSMLRSAHVLAMSQPACSKLLHQLEAYLGTRLFARHPRGMTLTVEGEAFVRHARLALDEIARASDAVRTLREGLSGSVALGTEATAATSLVPQAVALMKVRYPRVTVSIELAFSEQLIRHLRAGRLDLVIARPGSLEDEVELIHNPLPLSEHVLAVRADHPLLAQTVLTWPTLLDHGWILPPAGNVMRTSFAGYLRTHGFDLPQQLIETAALPIVTALLRQSEFVAPLPRNIVYDHATRGLLAALPLPLELDLPAASLIHRREPFSPTMVAMLATLREAVASVRVKQEAESA
jgi:DNA-binding transcriptional LysR family regulator